MSFALPNTFWQKVDKMPGFGPRGDCWRWTGAKNSAGYGSFQFDKVSYMPHRLIYIATHGSLEASDGFSGQVVCHECDEPLCVKPAHLFVGGGWDNQNDKVAKGRHAYGARHSRAVLTDETVSEIRRATGTNADVAVQFGVSPTTISYVRNRRTWRHVV